MVRNQTPETDAEPPSIDSEPIVRLFDNPSNVRILVVLADAAGAALPPGDIAEQANIDRSAWYRNKDELLELGVIEEAGEVGNTQTYRFATDTEAYQGFTHLYDGLIDQVND
ncbi:hypothetical protein HLRTI_002917 [Halorhabdus tiamatea SARL4B]|uniref:Uncharacterized protein n=1 Tax=Halorhabdus tiamatea SARL4B TaxID=1033806 RepID=U2DY68_9EURY|nr:hypothetical protein [Halorhabdus tiamatea]ERJ05118.1 hypothetical protein HLRTI_002917 [Halorhabdus tiamatea SARL4B]